MSVVITVTRFKWCNIQPKNGLGKAGKVVVMNWIVRKLAKLLWT